MAERAGRGGSRLTDRNHTATLLFPLQRCLQGQHTLGRSSRPRSCCRPGPLAAAAAAAELGTEGAAPARTSDGGGGAVAGGITAAAAGSGGQALGGRGLTLLRTIRAGKGTRAGVGGGSESGGDGNQRRRERSQRKFRAPDDGVLFRGRRVRLPGRDNVP